MFMYFCFLFFKEELEVNTKLTLSVWGSAGVKAMFFFKEELEVMTKLTLSVWGSAGVKAMSILFER